MGSAKGPDHRTRTPATVSPAAAGSCPTSTPLSSSALRTGSITPTACSNTLTEGTWHPTTVLTGDPVQTVARLKARPGRELQIHGSARLGDSLLTANLIDTLRIVVAPTVLRTGRRLFAGDGATCGLHLLRQEVTPAGLIMLEYDVTDQAPTGEYHGVTELING